MGKRGGSSSWLNAVKKAFRSPSKDMSDKRSCRSEDLEQQEQEKRRGKRRWIFGKPIHSKDQICMANTPINIGNEKADHSVATNSVAEAEAVAAAAAAEAAVATAQVAVEFIRLTRRPCILMRQNQAATTIQKAFKGYLARRALTALKGLVKLQALIRGHNVRKRTELTLLRMQALVRVQTRVCNQRRRLSVSHEGSLNTRSFTDKSHISKDGDWDENGSVGEEIASIYKLGMTKEAAWKCERDLAYAFSDKIWRSSKEEYTRSECRSEKTHQWESPGRYSCDQRIPIKIVQVDDKNPLFSSVYLKPREENHYQQIPSLQSPIKPYQHDLKHLRVHSSSPRCLKEEEPMYRKSQTPSLACFHRMSHGAVPSYMAQTASAKARVRSQSVPRQQRPSTPEREGAGFVKRRLFFGAPDEISSASSRNTQRGQS